MKKDVLLKWKEQLLTVFTLSSVNFMLAIINNFSDICGHIDKKVQTCTAYRIDLEQLAETITSMHIRGIDRIVPIGKTLDISTIWDGYDVIGQLSRYITYESHHL